MKRLLVLLLLGALLLLTACGGGDVTTTTTTSTTLSENPEQPIAPRVWLNTYDKYEAFLQRNVGNLSEHFISYDRVSVLGDFDLLACEKGHSFLKNSPESSQETYFYNFERKWDDWENHWDFIVATNDAFFATPILSPVPGTPPDSIVICTLVISYNSPLDKGGRCYKPCFQRKTFEAIGMLTVITSCAKCGTATKMEC